MHHDAPEPVGSGRIKMRIFYLSLGLLLGIIFVICTHVEDGRAGWFTKDGNVGAAQMLLASHAQEASSAPNKTQVIPWSLHTLSERLLAQLVERFAERPHTRLVLLSRETALR